MKKFRKWLIDRFLPRWAYESLLEELAAANKKQEELRQTVERQQCYISGLEYALRHMTTKDEAALGGRRQTIACGRAAFGKLL